MMKEITREFAQYLFFGKQKEVFGLRANGTEAVIEDADDFYAFDMFGVEE